jgi:hypothetical protein
MTAEQELADYWYKQVATWQKSGLSCQAFCNQHNLIYHRFAYWKKKYQTRELRTTENSASGSGFTQVIMAKGLASYPPTSTSTTTSTATSALTLTLTLPSGITIGGLHPDNIAWLGALLEQLG